MEAAVIVAVCAWKVGLKEFTAHSPSRVLSSSSIPSAKGRSWVATGDTHNSPNNLGCIYSLPNSISLRTFLFLSVVTYT
jgi:hypothetical protein